MKILILVQACDDAPYLEMNRAQMETWDSINEDGVDTIYYLGDNKMIDSRLEINYRLEGKKLYCKCSERYDMMHWRMKMTLDYVWGYDWDFIFRTNSSSYVDKKKLKQFATNLPTENCYCGIDGGGFASGSGVFISRDMASIIKDTIDDYPTASEDCCMGTILAKRNINVTPGAQRFDYYFTSHESIPDIYHYRCKSNDADRNKDIIAFKRIFYFKNRT